MAGFLEKIEFKSISSAINLVSTSLNAAIVESPVSASALGIRLHVPNGHVEVNFVENGEWKFTLSTSGDEIYESGIPQSSGHQIVIGSILFRYLVYWMQSSRDESGNYTPIETLLESSQETEAGRTAASAFAYIVEIALGKYKVSKTESSFAAELVDLLRAGITG